MRWSESRVERLERDADEELKQEAHKPLHEDDEDRDDFDEWPDDHQEEAA